MKNRILGLIATISLFANENRLLTNVSFEIDEDGDVSPNFFYPIYWSENLFSGFGYKSLTTTENGDISGFSDSRKSLSIDQQNFKINLLSGIYRKDGFSASIGLSTEYIKIDKSEFGFIHDQNGVFGSGNEWIAFDNFVEVDVLKYGVYFEFMTSPIENLFFRVSGDITPTADIDIEQESRFKPLVSKTGDHNGKEKQELSYSALGEVTFKFPTVSVGAEYEYSFFPLEYDLKSISKNSSGYFFTTARENSETTTKSWLIKLIINKKIFGDMSPSFGYGEREITAKDITDSSETAKSETILRFGFENRF